MIINSTKNIGTVISAFQRERLIKANVNISKSPEAFLEIIIPFLGEPIISDVSSPHKDIPYIHLVCNSRIKKLDRFGLQTYSTTNLAIPCHTEDFFDEIPADILVLFCIKAAEKGGESFLANVKGIVNKLDKKTIDLLQKPIFPSYSGYKKILNKIDSDFCISYSRVIIDKAIEQYGLNCSEQAKKAINILDHVIEEEQNTITLVNNDILIIDNNRFLHGRTSFPDNSDRLLYRVKVRSI